MSIKIGNIVFRSVKEAVEILGIDGRIAYKQLNGRNVEDPFPFKITYVDKQGREYIAEPKKPATKLKAAKPVKAKKSPKNNIGKPYRDRKPVMCLETQEVFESILDAMDWHYKTTGFKSDIYNACIRGNATKGGYHLTYVAK